MKKTTTEAWLSAALWLSLATQAECARAQEDCDCAAEEAAEAEESEAEPAEDTEPLQPMDRVGVPVPDLAPIVVPLDIEPDGDGIVGRTRVESGANTRFLQAKLLVVATSPVSELTVIVRDGDGDIVDRLKFDGVMGAREAWTGLVPGRWLKLEAQGTRQAEGVQLVVQQVFRSAIAARPLSIVGKDGRVLIKDVTDDRLKLLARSTAKLTFHRDNRLYNCTTFLIPSQAGSRLMTNNHCISDAASCSSAVVIFDFNVAAPIPTQGQSRCKRILATDYVLDYTVFELDRSPPQGVNPLKLSTSALVAKAPALIVQHPGGKPKQLSSEGCEILDPIVRGRGPKTDFTHSCDTLGGSSGSAILTPAGEVLGLHHLGRGGAFPDENRGVRLDLITADLKRKGVMP